MQRKPEGARATTVVRVPGRAGGSRRGRAADALVSRYLRELATDEGTAAGPPSLGGATVTVRGRSAATPAR